ncbi:hypothetical protein SDC9_209931 [bioreactor metagenome]|uniref:Uncharacterized protein n=1 Tax=bioreactor metagenome TaxID=1076179 RepID=A0A645JPH2_9ZZZZ
MSETRRYTKGVADIISEAFEGVVYISSEFSNKKYAVTPKKEAKKR